jgi:hypothetical protein
MDELEKSGPGLTETFQHFTGGTEGTHEQL